MAARGHLRVGIVGIGFGQHVHVPAFRSDERVSVQAVCASTEARARAVAERLSIPQASGDWRALVSDPSIDAVAISVPPALQAPIALAALRAGKHLFAEKPLAATAAEAADLCKAAREQGLVGAIDFEFRVVAAWQKARELLSAGTVGRLRSVYLGWRIETLAYRDPKPSWKRDGGAGGGTLNLFVSHSLDSILWLFGPVRRLAARLEPSTGADARVDLWLELADGTPVAISASADAPGGSGHRLEVYGDEGALFLENSSSDYINGFTLTVKKRQVDPMSVELPRAPAGSDGRVVAVSAIVRRFVDAIELRGEMTPGLADGLAVQKLIDAAREASRSGTWQS